MIKKTYNTELTADELEAVIFAVQCDYETVISDEANWPPEEVIKLSVLLDKLTTIDVKEHK